MHHTCASRYAMSLPTPTKEQSAGKFPLHCSQSSDSHQTSKPIYLGNKSLWLAIGIWPLWRTIFLVQFASSPAEDPLSTDRLVLTISFPVEDKPLTHKAYRPLTRCHVKRARGTFQKLIEGDLCALMQCLVSRCRFICCLFAL